MSKRKSLARRPDWEPRLSDVIAANRDRDHAFGAWDCLLWPAAAVEAVTGHDFGRGHRGKYRSQASAYRHLNGLGFASPDLLLDSLFPAKGVAFAQRGDLVLVTMPEVGKAEAGAAAVAARKIPGVVFGDHALVVGELFAAGDLAATGFLYVPRSRWVKAWGVGDHHGRTIVKRRNAKKGAPAA